MDSQELMAQARRWQGVFAKLRAEATRNVETDFKTTLILDSGDAQQLARICGFAVHKANEDIGRAQPLPLVYTFEDDTEQVEG